MRIYQLAFAAIIGCAFVTSAVAAPGGYSLPEHAMTQKVTWVCDPSHCTWQPGAGPGRGMEPRAGWGNPNSPCGQIRAACLSAGFVPGGSGTGVGVQFDCIHPIIEGRPQRPRATLPLPPINPQIVAACRAILAQGGGGPPMGPGAQGGGGPPMGPGGQPRYVRPGPGAPPPPPSDGGPPPPPGSQPPPGAEAPPDSEQPPPGAEPPPGAQPQPGPPPPPDNQ
jgi:hypothetical protein